MNPNLFVTAFTAAYAAEMDWRIDRGGVTAEEVAGAAAAGGQETPDATAVEGVQAMWRAAIDDFVSGEVERASLDGWSPRYDKPSVDGSAKLNLVEVKKDIEKALTDVVRFVEHIRKRIDQYLVFGDQIRLVDHAIGMVRDHVSVAPEKLAQRFGGTGLENAAAGLFTLAGAPAVPPGRAASARPPTRAHR